jgi:predicted protein tyrosine phosphatase
MGLSGKTALLLSKKFKKQRQTNNVRCLAIPQEFHFSAKAYF